ncbi:ribonuclease P protein component [Planctellipticum variicoloris]|uniref:ribonuclease P protein component n=1 Tax=Planctellipticum variicoloris TaxID=3064265 RepID=UPI002B831A5B|nr:ribonuclease P protein component [Planctomycetaceae bacterium SH412]HTN05057.1 ribonuclease P protein component [Planctomycetaceae bacterium]
MTIRFPFPPTAHLRRGADFRRVYDRKCKAADGVLLVFIDRSPQAETRIGLSVSRKHGNAVVRNRLKRLLREAFRLSSERLPAGLDLVAIPLAKDRASLPAYIESLTRLCRKLLRRLEAAEAPPAEGAPS